MVETEFELLAEFEEEFEDESTELELLVPTGHASAGRFGRGPVVACSGPAQAVVSGFLRYSNSVASLSRAEREKVRRIAALIARSFRPGCQPFRVVRLLGHADRDVRLGPAFERRISVARAAAVEKALKRLVANPTIAARIVWAVSGAGATALVVPNPRTELERRRNRRVEVWLDGAEPSGPDYVRWVQGCLNRVMSLRLPLTGVMEPRTRSAIRAFQQRQGLAITGVVTPETLASFISACGFPQIRPAAGGWADGATSGAATSEPVIVAPSTGWNRAVARLATINPNFARIDRIPLEGLTTANPSADRSPSAVEAADQRAIALVPTYLDQQNTKIDVLLHLHGHNVGYRQRLRPGITRCTQLIGSVRDIECDRAEHQLENWASINGGPIPGSDSLIAVLAQGTGGSDFGAGTDGMFLDPNAYLNEIFQSLIARNALPQTAQPGRTILSGHSGAGRPLSKMLESGNVPSNLGMVLLFDAINAFPNKVPVTAQTQYVRFRNWVLAQIGNDLRNLASKTTEADQLDYLSRSMRFFGFCSNGAYLPAYQALDAAIKALVKSKATVPPLASDRVVRALSDASANSLQGNYQIVFVGHKDHDAIVGMAAPGLKQALPLQSALERFPKP
jgi:peptidoglycan hydrolase-like protein with peptidoglycan-binding domain